MSDDMERRVRRYAEENASRQRSKQNVMRTGTELVQFCKLQMSKYGIPPDVTRKGGPVYSGDQILSDACYVAFGLCQFDVKEGYKSEVPRVEYHSFRARGVHPQIDLTVAQFKENFLDDIAHSLENGITLRPAPAPPRVPEPTKQERDLDELAKGCGCLFLGALLLIVGFLVFKAFFDPGPAFPT
ncbi:MAG: hypothetical protein EON59_01685 [Alphaproteobacteria bacterium]|nr:MAG: hypothetical protein EON59_01685 [Alphaproteobacteria bacterium]